MRREVSTLALPGGAVVPALLVDSERPGPTAVVTANLHGDECTGIAAVHALSSRLGEALVRGRVWLYPSLNPAGLAAITRGLPGEELDPNRGFPGLASGGPVSRHARAIWDELMSRRPELVLDLHTDAGGAVPYALVDRVLRGSPALEERCLALAAASGLIALREFPPDAYQKLNLDRSLPGALMNVAGVAAITLEVGPRRAIAPDAVELAVGAVLAVLGVSGLVRATPRAPPWPGAWRREAGPRATRAGVLVPVARPGDTLRAEAIVAEVRALDGGVLERLCAPRGGRVLSLVDRAWATAGLSCATLAVPD